MVLRPLSSFAEWVASKQRDRAAIMKQTRLLREEKRHEKKHQGSGRQRYPWDDDGSDPGNPGGGKPKGRAKAKTKAKADAGGGAAQQ